MTAGKAGLYSISLLPAPSLMGSDYASRLSQKRCVCVRQQVPVEPARPSDWPSEMLLPLQPLRSVITASLTPAPPVSLTS